VETYLLTLVVEAKLIVTYQLRFMTQRPQWHSYITFKRFRHAVFIIDSFLYIHGGLGDEKHNNTANVQEVNLVDVFEKDTVILPKLKTYLAEKKKTQSPVNDQSDNFLTVSIYFNSRKRYNRLDQRLKRI
jgi:hypothetical protein